MCDLVTGKLIIPLRTHPKILGLSDVGGRGEGDVLIGFDKDAFTSYGLAQSANAAVSEDAAASYRAALNHLIKETGFRMAGAKVVHWFKKRIPVDDDPLSFLFEADTKQEIVAQERCRELLTSVRTGKRPDLGENHFYSLTLSGASGRVMVRDWMEGSFQELLTSIVLWFDDLAIIHRDGSRLAPDPKFMAVLGGTVRELKDLPPNVTTRLWRAALKKEAIPFSVLAQALNRAKIDIVNNQPFNHARMGLIKAFNLRQNRSQGGDSMSDTLKPFLNEHHPHPAYHCGRLLAVMAALQRRALGDVGAGVVQRYYAAASTTPALVLGRLSRLSQFHLNKLDNPGLAIWYENLIAGIWGRMKDSPPGVLNLEEQSLFALGYYQQIASLRSPKAGNDQPEKGEKNE
jgi:CRISPR-associated protein Csd1